MPLADSLLQELEREAKPTRELLSRVPTDRLGWQPHPKSMSLGQLAQHVASLPGGIARMGLLESMDAGGIQRPPDPQSTSAILATFDAALEQAREVLRGMDDSALMQSWRLTKDGRTLLDLPRAGLYRTILLNHLYHHRGQLTVYLRMLDVPLPVIYGPSADENPFA